VFQFEGLFHDDLQGPARVGVKALGTEDRHRFLGVGRLQDFTKGGVIGVGMARALMASPKVLLLDEPSMGLAPLIVLEIFRLIETLRDQGITILLVEQNARAALSIADKGYVMELGRIVMSGAGPELLRNEQIQQAYLGM
jgi:ABC-type branched-subunit amino acid transport system ATPase component